MTMSRCAFQVLPLLLAGAFSTFSTQAIPPPPDSFDGETVRCQLAGSAATVLICRDVELKALDGQLRQSFRRLRDDTSLKQPERESLVEDQRRWVATMDQCWRAGEGLRSCVKASQLERLQQLESMMIQRRLMPAGNYEGKGCDSWPGHQSGLPVWRDYELDYRLSSDTRHAEQFSSSPDLGCRTLSAVGPDVWKSESGQHGCKESFRHDTISLSGGHSASGL